MIDVLHMKTLGTQFVHIDLHGTKKCGKRLTVHAVLAEASRQPDACLHISNPKPPICIFGLPIEQLKLLHDRQHSQASLRMHDGKQRRIRTDQLTMMSCVASCEVSFAQMDADPETAKAVIDWATRVVNWLSLRYGKKLKSVVMHTDEAYIHVHAYILPDDAGMRAKALHDGEVAKLACQTSAIAAGESKKMANKMGNAAYLRAMREFQNDYWLNVGLPSGQLRVGPRRRRLTRAEWHAEQAQIQNWRTAHEQLAARGRQLQSRIEQLESELERPEANQEVHAEKGNEQSMNG
jgi:hypothetical protein